MARPKNSMLVMHYGIEAAARNTPDKTALIADGRSLTFAELDARANQTAQGLLDSGLQKGDKVVVNLLNCLEYPEIIHGCSKAGVALVPISFLLAPSEVDYIVSHSEARMVFVSEKIAQAIQPAGESGGRHVKTVVVGGESQWGESYETWRNKQPTDKPEVEVEENDVFYIGYTSGTTGRPKGAVISHRSRLLACLAGALEYGLGPEDVGLTVAPIYHAAPIAFLLLQLYMGGAIVILPGFAPNEMLATIEKNRITSAFMVPAMLQAVNQLSEKEKSRYDLSSLRVIVSAGAPLPTKTKEETLAFFKGVNLNEFYGSTEAPLNTNLRPKDQLRKIKCCGKPIIGWEVKLLDDKRETVTTPNTVGEVFVRGELLFDGYLKNRKATDEAFHDGWFSAGDLGEMDEEGYLYIVDRKKDMIISGGVNIYPIEIEDCLLHHPAVADAAVIGVPDDKWGEAVMAIIQLKPGEQADEKDIIDFCNDRIAKYKKPKKVVFTPGIPKSPSGKTLKNTLRELFTEKAS